MSAGAPRLSPATLGDLADTVARPRYDRRAVQGGVVHLGAGAFHRAHQAVMFDEVLSAGDLRWGVRGVSLRSPDVRDRLAPQGGLYGLLVRDGSAETARVVGALQDVAVAPESPQAVVELIADPAVHLVTLTITEAGYLRDAATGEPLWDHPDVRHDLARPDAPRTAPGLLAAGLALRRARGLAAVSVLSCDNLPSAGRATAGVVDALLRRRDPRMADAVARDVAFPDAMVDRITPASTPSDGAAFALRAGLADAATVATEPFTQWVVEDRFAGPRPDLEAAGVQVVAAVAPFEVAKLRLLNGAHSALAYLGALAGVEFVHEVVALPIFGAVVVGVWNEAADTLAPAPGLDLARYRVALASRFGNAALRHRTRQIAADGSQKLAQRLLSPLAARRDRGLASPALALAVAGWMRWQGGRTDAGEPLAADDPLAGRLRAAYAAAGDPRARVRALLSVAGMDARGLADDAALVSEVAAALDALERGGASAAASRFAAARFGPGRTE